MNPTKQKYRAIKYVWKAEWIGEEAFKKEVLCAQQACVSDILTDYSQDQSATLSEAQIKLTVMHIQKYGQCKVENVGDRCYVKVSIEVLL